jgi:hypothetical protein
MNKGILCGPCNEGFSSLDAKLAQQLVSINGFIGVRPDRADEPKPVRVDSVEGPLSIDHTGRPAYAEPRLVSEAQGEDGKRIVTMSFASERQIQDWYEKQRAAGLTPKVLRREEGVRFVSGPVSIEWTFGGQEAFREIGRIALNFLAHRWPELARTPELRPFKDFVQGTARTSPQAPKRVWYADETAPRLQPSPFEFGHQILIVVDAPSSQVYGRVCLFSTFDLYVSFGSVPLQQSSVALFDINPLAEQPPDDLRVSIPSWIPIHAEPPGVPDRVDQMLYERLRSLFVRVQDRQWRTGTRGLLEAVNSMRSASPRERAQQIAKHLEPHLGRVLLLAREVAAGFRQELGKDETGLLVAEGLERLLEPDPSTPDGLSNVSRAALCAGLAGLASAIGEEVERGELSDASLRLYLEGGLGLHAVGTVLTNLVLRAIGLVAPEPS